MIGHETVGVNCKIARGGSFAKDSKSGLADGRVPEKGKAAVAAEGHENGGLAGIVLGVEADDFTGGH